MKNRAISTTSISLDTELLKEARRAANRLGISVSEFIAQLLETATKKQQRLLEQQYAEAEKDPARQEIISDLRTLDDEGWPDE